MSFAFNHIIECCNKKHDLVEIATIAKMEWQAMTNALEVLANIPIEDFNKQDKPSYPLMVWNGHELNVGHVLAARKAINWNKP